MKITGMTDEIAKEALTKIRAKRSGLEAELAKLKKLELALTQSLGSKGSGRISEAGKAVIAAAARLKAARVRGDSKDEIHRLEREVEKLKAAKPAK